MKTLSAALLCLLLCGCAATSGSQGTRYKMVPSASNPELYQRLSNVAQRVIPLMDTANWQRYKIAVIDTDDLGAFIDSTKYVLAVYRGLMERFTDQELMFVIGHETAHVILGHHARRLAASYTTTAVIGVAGAFVPGLGALNYIANPIVVSGFSRPQETDADLESARFLYKTYNIPPDVSISALRKLEEYALSKGITENNRIGILDTHPSIQKRIEAIREASRQFRS